MELGWADSAPRLRSRLPNLNLLPAELLPTPLPWLTAGLVLLSLGLLSLLYALFYMREYTAYEVEALRGRLADGQTALRAYGLPVDAVGPDGQLLLPPGTLEDWAELRARQVDWAAVFGTVAANAGPAVQISGLSQTGYTVSIAGDAATTQDANNLLQKLRDSGLFASLEMNVAQQPDVATAVPTPATSAQATAVPTPPPGGPPPPGGGPPTPPGAGHVVPPPPATAPAIQAPAKPSTAPPPVVNPPAPAQPTATLAPRTPLPSPSPVGTPPTVAPTATATAALDFIVQSKRETVDPVAIGNNSSVRVRVLDANGQLVPNLRAHIDSQGTPAWSAELPRPGDQASNGTFEFPVGMGKFTVFIANGSSERAADLFTGVQGQPGVHVWDVTFRKTIGGTPAAEPTCPGCTATPTNTPAPPTPTPISPGPNLARLACVTGSSQVNDDVRPFRAVDNDVNSFWDSGLGPVQQLTLDFTRYPNEDSRACQAKPIAGARALDPSTSAVNLDDFNAVVLEGLELVEHMGDRSKVTTEIWTIYDSDSVQLEYTFADVDAADFTTLSAKFAAVRTVKQVRIRTIRSGQNVGWREVRLFEPLPPAFGQWTATPTLTPTIGASATALPTPPGTSQIAITSASASSENPGNPAGYAADNNAATFWRPLANSSGPYLQANFASAQTLQTVRIQTASGEAIATATATVGPNTPTATPQPSTYRVVLLRNTAALQAQSGRSASAAETPITRRAQDVVSCYSQTVIGDNAVIQGDCAGGPYTGVTGVQVFIDSIQNPNVPPGIREVSAYGPSVTTPTGTPTPTPTFCAGPTVPVCSPTSTVTGTPTGPTSTATITPTVTISSAGSAATQTAVATQTQAAATAAVIATATEQTIASQTAVAGTATAAASQTATAQTATAVASATAAAGTDLAAGKVSAAFADSSSGVNVPGRAVDTATPTVQDLSTYWESNTTTSDVNWGLNFNPSVTVGAVYATLHSSAAGGSATVTIQLTNTNNITVLSVPTVVASPDGKLVTATFSPPIQNVKTVTVMFTNVTGGTPGLKAVSVYQSAAQRASTSLIDRLLAELSVPFAAITAALEPGRALAAPEEQQAYPPPGAPTKPIQAALPPAVQTQVATSPPPPSGQVLQPTPAVIGAPQAVATAFPPSPPVAAPQPAQPVPQPAPQVRPAAPPAPIGVTGPGTTNPLAAAPPAPTGRGRVSFVIVAQVRPGGP
jgi:hypothetical protein